MPIKTGPRSTSPAEPAVGAGRALALLIAVAGVLGWLAALQLTLDDRRMLQDPAFVPGCNISPVVGCGSVLRTWQAGLLGIPNMVLGLAAFAVVAATGLGLLTGTRLHRRLWLALNAGTLLGVVFVHWLIYESLYVLGRLCPYCAVVWVVTIALFWYITLHNLKRGVIRVPARARAGAEAVLSLHWVLLLTWYAVIVMLVLTRFWSYWRTLV
jgi:uncharacterized membrane protein